MAKKREFGIGHLPVQYIYRIISCKMHGTARYVGYRRLDKELVDTMRRG